MDDRGTIRGAAIVVALACHLHRCNWQSFHNQPLPGTKCKKSNSAGSGAAFGSGQAPITHSRRP